MITLDVEKINGCDTRRTRKVYYQFYDSESRKPHPMIRLQGHYLEKKGFMVGDHITVELEYGRITITKVNPGNGDSSHD
jgi:hypothetical protein